MNAIADADLTLLWGRAAARCSFPTCKKELPAGDRPERLLQTAHIVSGRQKGPRADPTFPRGAIDRYPNLIVLCLEHHTKVDANSGSAYSAEDLLGFRRDHEDWVQARLARGEPWEMNISQLEYVNVPRLAMLSAITGYPVSFPEIPGNLHDLAGELALVLRDLRLLVGRLAVTATQLSEESISELQPGELVSFSNSFRTRGMPYADKLDEFQMTGDVARDPAISLAMARRRLLMTLDPRWVGTSTAFAEFRRGWCRVAGLAQIKAVDRKTTFATPLIVGIPSPDDWHW